MAKFGFNDAENYGGTTAGYFSLKNDGDSAIVRFMYNSINDIEGYAVHKVTVGDRTRFVNCLRDYSEPLDNCPLCASRNFQSAKFYFPLYNVETEEVCLWDRGKNIIKTLGPVLNDIKGVICGTPIKITRHGVAGDTNTTYSFELMASDECTLEDLPDVPNPMDNIILSFTYDELTEYTKTGKLPIVNAVTNTDTNNYTDDNATVIRRSYTPRNSGNSGTAF